MKPSLFALLFLFAFIAISAKAQFVVDTLGNPVVNGGNYYILPQIPLAGGLRLAETGNETCPLSVVQALLPVDIGLPWTFKSQLNATFIAINTNLTFFSVDGKVPDCVPLPSKWTIVEGDDGIKSVKITGSVDTVEGWFRIQQHNGAYKIVYCPINSESCGDLGISSTRRLVITTDGNPLTVVIAQG